MRIQSFKEFWPYYLGEHRQEKCRWLHYFGTSMGILFFLGVLLFQRWNWLGGVLVCGYGPAWFAHFFIEKNRPATFTYPWWSLRADFKMWWYFIRGQIEAELEKIPH
jgi:hypothetical protein